MGLFNLIKDQQSTTQLSNINIDTNQLLGVDNQAITPNNPGQFGIHRTAPVLDKPRSFSVAEANRINELAAKRTIEAGATEKAVEGLKTIKTADTKEQIAYNSYRVHEANKTFKQVQSNANAGNQIAKLSSGYTHLHESVRHRLAVEEAKNQAITGLGTKVAEFSKLW